MAAECYRLFVPKWEVANLGLCLTARPALRANVAAAVSAWSESWTRRHLAGFRHIELGLSASGWVWPAARTYTGVPGRPQRRNRSRRPSMWTGRLAGYGRFEPEGWWTIDDNCRTLPRNECQPTTGFWPYQSYPPHTDPINRKFVLSIHFVKQSTPPPSSLPLHGNAPTLIAIDVATTAVLRRSIGDKEDLCLRNEMRGSSWNCFDVAFRMSSSRFVASFTGTVLVMAKESRQNDNIHIFWLLCNG